MGELLAKTLTLQQNQEVSKQGKKSRKKVMTKQLGRKGRIKEYTSKSLEKIWVGCPYEWEQERKKQEPSYCSSERLYKFSV